jgi:hypothetical protein
MKDMTSKNLSSQEKKEIVTKMFLDEGFHIKLLKLYEKIRFGLIVSEPDSIYNFGLSEISTEQIQGDHYVFKNTAKFNDKKFTISYYSNSRIFPDGEESSWKHIEFYLFDKLLIHVSYTDEREVIYLPEKLVYSHLYEFHHSKELKDFMNDLISSIDDQEIKIKEFEERDKFDPDEDKFSF